MATSKKTAKKAATKTTKRTPKKAVKKSVTKSEEKNEDLQPAKVRASAHNPQDSGASGTKALTPSSFDPMILSPDMVDCLINSDVKKPSWKSNKYPVSMEEFKKLQAMAAIPDRMSLMALASADGSEADTDNETPVAKVGFDLPEDGPTAAAPSVAAPSVTTTFEAIASTGWNPPDCVVASGPNDVVACVNSEFRIYSKTGSLKRRNPYGPFFSSVLPNSTGVKIFDPRIIWDHYNSHYVMIVAATQSSPARSWCGVAVSKTADPMGAWWVWALDAALDGGTATTNWMDYPMLGFDGQAVFLLVAIRLNVFAY